MTETLAARAPHVHDALLHDALHYTDAKDGGHGRMCCQMCDQMCSMVNRIPRAGAYTRIMGLARKAVCGSARQGVGGWTCRAMTAKPTDKQQALHIWFRQAGAVRATFSKPSAILAC
jgi:hypothetical protein